MDRDTVEVKYRKRAERLVYIASLSSFLVSVIYVLVVITPLVVFHGFIQGYYSPIEYELVYAYNTHRILLPHTEYIRSVVITYIGLSLFLAVSSTVSFVYAKKNTYTATGLAYGVSLALIVLYGLLYGYIFRAVSYDMSLLSISSRNGLVYETLAGEIWFTDTWLEYTITYQLVYNTPALLALLFISTVASTTATSISLYAYYKQSESKRDPKPSIVKQLTSYTAIPLISLVLFASMYTYYPSSLIIRPQPPPATLEPPTYTYTCTNLARTAREALAYTDFEVYPVPGWTSRGGTWSSVSGVAGAKGNVLRGTDDGRGIGGESQYYYDTDLSTHTSLWVAVKTMWASGSGNQYYGIGMMNSARNRAFVVEIFTTGVTTGYLDIWSYNVAVRNDWSRHARVTIPNYSQFNWYTIVVYYTVSGTTISITAYLYDAGGNYVTSASATISNINVFRPAYIGVTVDFTTIGGSLTAYFDEFIISTTDPRSIFFTGFTPGMRVEVWDNLGLLVNSTTSPSSSFYLNVTSDVVVGTGVDGRIITRYPDGQLCGVLVVPVTDAILGGDTYALTTRSIVLSQGANKTSASLTVYISGSALFNTTARILRINASQVLYARLLLNNITPLVPLYLDIWLEGATRSTNISIVNGAPVSVSTSVVQLNTGLSNNITLTGYLGATGQSIALVIKLELCTAPGNQGACVYQPINITLLS